MMDSEKMTPLDLLESHRYAEAAAAYADYSKKGDPVHGAPGGYAKACLCLGRLEEAVTYFRLANKRASEKLKGETQPYLALIGTAEWLLGRRAEAIRTLTQSVDGVLDGSIGYGDQAGGVEQGVLLWYAGVTAQDMAASEHALKYLRKLAGKSRIQYWPGPLALFALGERSEEEVLKEACGVGQLDAAAEEAHKNLLKRRHLVNSLFYFGVRQRVNGCEEQCRQWMRRCFALENPIVECEWYLARGEVAAAGER